MSAIRITYDGRPALTIAQAAERYGLTQAAMRRELSRLAARGEVAPHDESLDGRTPLYDRARLDAAMKARPGRGRRGRSSDSVT